MLYNYNTIAKNILTSFLLRGTLHNHSLNFHMSKHTFGALTALTLLTATPTPSAQADGVIADPTSRTAITACLTDSRCASAPAPTSLSNTSTEPAPTAPTKSSCLKSDGTGYEPCSRLTSPDSVKEMKLTNEYVKFEMWWILEDMLMNVLPDYLPSYRGNVNFDEVWYSLTQNPDLFRPLFEMWRLPSHMDLIREKNGNYVFGVVGLPNANTINVPIVRPPDGYVATKPPAPNNFEEIREYFGFFK